MFPSRLRSSALKEGPGMEQRWGQEGTMGGWGWLDMKLWGPLVLSMSPSSGGGTGF